MADFMYSFYGRSNNEGCRVSRVKLIPYREMNIKVSEDDNSCKEKEGCFWITLPELHY